MSDEEIDVKAMIAGAQQAEVHDQQAAKEMLEHLRGENERYWVEYDYDEPDADGVIGESLHYTPSLDEARWMARYEARERRRKVHIMHDRTGEILFEYDAEGNEQKLPNYENQA